MFILIWVGAEFLDVEAEVSGSDVSEDEKVDEDGFEESFVDDATQREDTAMYLRYRLTSWS